MVSIINLFFFFFFGSTENHTQGLEHARQVLDCGTTSSLATYLSMHVFKTSCAVLCVTKAQRGMVGRPPCHTGGGP